MIFSVFVVSDLKIRVKDAELSGIGLNQNNSLFFARSCLDIYLVKSWIFLEIYTSAIPKFVVLM